MNAPYLWDDGRARRFAPFALTRPAGELRAGAVLGRERWARLFGQDVAGFVADAHLAGFDEAGAPPAVDLVPAGAVLANSRCLPSLGSSAGAADAWTCGGRLAAVRLARDVTAEELAATATLDELRSGAASAELAGRWLDEVWDLVATLPELLADDIRALAVTLEVDGAPAGATVLGAHEVFVERGAVVEPMVCLDASAGPILLRSGATVSCFTRLVGPCYVGEHSTVVGGRVAATSIGEWCKVSGEVNSAIFHSYANKGHEGFVGHSVIGRWANLGAGTTTSNLKNTYGPVQLWTPDGVRETGLQFLGTLVGDHAKTAIGTRLNTGTVVGAGANVFGGAVPGKAVRPFAWGEGGTPAVYDLERFLQVAERVMRRRGVALSEGARRQLTAAHARASAS